MRSNKRYTNTTFTKRVDHEEGLRPMRHALEPLVCKGRGTFYLHQHWTNARDVPRKKRPSLGLAFPTLCPACRQQREALPRGFVHLDGTFLSLHREEIERLLSNAANRATENNPLARILGWERSGIRQITVKTTTEHLAQRLGHELQ
ncbi:MAG TPA: hypothetical protein VGL91_09295 [Acidobacteriota bacterium]|jgi:hypothetical protein